MVLWIRYLSSIDCLEPGIRILSFSTLTELMILSERVVAGFFVSSMNFMFGIRLLTSPLSCRPSFTPFFCALKYIYRMSLSSTTVFTDSIYAMYHLRYKLFSSQTSPYVFKILHPVSFIQERGYSVGFVWIASHSGIEGNEQADYVPRSASWLPFVVYCGVPYENLFSVLKRDFKFWCSFLWPYVDSAVNLSRYFDRVSFKIPRPWFMDYKFSRGYISLIIRLGSAHECIGTQYRRMGWDLDVRCGCGAELKDLTHLVNEFMILSEARTRFFAS